MAFPGKGEQCSLLQQGEVFLWAGPKFTYWISLKRAHESAAPFDFVYVLEIASPLQLAWLSVWVCALNR